ncbi:hypothetical protein BBO99_00008632 [Phytophthora kernoviae]|uniref:Proteasome activator complex subunit 4 C-terminal domain-containing protein n=2 Tax=Phytophthora kernoviae TaxID=325452 RepID=A0A3R7G2X4_9STRA|nr:hypothetical protein G195_010011 [Phytophthora kernoviae 00238/432]KAG2510874.1 hypothetical protein JM16_008366 [Phytophthora kernoviae]KAG2514178.1 hypothetical protein JM18_008377 [Phytophthora kernoviae]RLN21100.1 hypothetical protein BBI17_008636 [Phytophthora kernoviae]RLN74958.1 hypothetical protein BBO99_00008632 [Phytophthora kernoviae]
MVLIDQWVEVVYLTFRPSRSGSVKLARLKPLATYLLQELEISFVRVTAEDYARQAKWLALVEAMGRSVVEVMSVHLREATEQSRVKFLKIKRRSERQEAESAPEDELKKTQDRLKTIEAKMMESILSLSAIVLAFPHDVPSFVPPIFEVLGPFLYMKKSSNTISFLEKAVKETLLDFKRTHQDNWLETKSKFTQPQLDVIEDVAIAPSYFS